MAGAPSLDTDRPAQLHSLLRIHYGLYGQAKIQVQDHYSPITTLCLGSIEMSRFMTKPTKWPLRPAKTRISLGIRPDWSDSLLCTHWVDSEDSDQTGRMPRLIWVFAGGTGHFVGFVMRWLKWTLLEGQKKYTCVSGFPTYPNFCPYPKHFITLLRTKSSSNKMSLIFLCFSYFSPKNELQLWSKG